MSLPELLSGGFRFWCGAALLAWTTVVVIGFIARRSSSFIFSTLVGLGSLFLLITSIIGGNYNIRLPLPLFLGPTAFHFMADPLGRWFLAAIGIVGITAAIFTPAYLHHLRKQVSIGLVWAFIAMLMASMAAVILAANALTFLVAWEMMALSSFALVATNHQQRSVQRAAMVYLGATRTGTMFLMGGFFWAYHLTGSWEFADWSLHGIVALGPALLIFVGLATKAGCWPFHLWLPIAHPAAPAPVSAIMSGVMIKTAIYAMIRFLVIGPHLDAPLVGPIILILGAISAFWGVLFALLQHDLKRLLAYSSVENIGIILMGLGIAIVGNTNHSPLLAQLGLAAALLHTMNHAVFKSLLFLGMGVVDARTHTRNAECLGGLIRRMPWTAASFIIGSASICAFPPLSGFASEWILYNGMFSLAQQGASAGVRLSGILLMGWLGLIGALALACFVKAVGIVFLGLPRSEQAAHAKEGSTGMIVAQCILAVLCILFGIGSYLMLIPIGTIASLPGKPLLFANSLTLPLPSLALILAATIGSIAALLFALARKRPSREYITWECGFGDLGPRMQYTASSFAQPISRLFGGIYRYGVKLDIRGNDRRHFPEEVHVESGYEPYLETRVYTPLLNLIYKAAGSFIMRVQAGSIRQYLISLVIALVLLIFMGYR